MALNTYQKMCYRWFGRIAENLASEKMMDDLEKAHMEVRAGAYLSTVWVNTLLTAVVTFSLIITMVLFIDIELWMILALMMVPVLCTLLAYFYLMSYPSQKAKSRARKIDLHLPYALNFISAMSSAGITPTEIFKSLSKQHIYGEIREEALWIYRDVGLLGRDVISAIRSNIHRTPSEKFKEFLQGAIVTVQSGGALKPYFMSKAEQYTRENRVVQKQLIESLGIMAEAYVTAAVAGVLLIIIIIPLMMIISQADVSELNFMYVFVFMIVPMIHIGFAVILSSMSQKV
jgi:flagellar protein FlaJ